MAHLEVLREMLAHEAWVQPGFTDRVLRQVRAGAPTRRTRWRDLVSNALNPVLAGVTALVGIGLVAEVAPVEMGPAIPVLGVLSAAATLAWNRVTDRRGGRTK